MTGLNSRYDISNIKYPPCMSKGTTWEKNISQKRSRKYSYSLLLFIKSVCNFIKCILHAKQKKSHRPMNHENDSSFLNYIFKRYIQSSD